MFVDQGAKARTSGTPTATSSLTSVVHGGHSFWATRIPAVVDRKSRPPWPTARRLARRRLENELGELILSNHRYADRIRFVSSGTEAAMSAIRLARGRHRPRQDHQVRWVLSWPCGCLAREGRQRAGHPWHVLFRGRSGSVREGNLGASAQRPRGARGVHCLSTKTKSRSSPSNPSPPTMACSSKTRSSCGRCVASAREGILLLFDEVISGFRVGFEGAAALYDIQPDVLAFGKIIGGGLPVGAYAASEEVMRHIAPSGPVYQAGTLSGNPVAMSAGVAQLDGVFEARILRRPRPQGGPDDRSCFGPRSRKGLQLQHLPQGQHFLVGLF